MGRYISSELEKLIVGMYFDNVPIREIARRTGRKSDNIRRMLIRRNIHTVNSTLVERKCINCGKAFVVPDYSVKKYCTESCQRASSHKVHDIERRTRKRDAIIDADITLEKLFQRDNGICLICGEPVDWNDVKYTNGKKISIGKYPTIDHIIPLSKGGKHSWNNVQLAHFRCNASKGVC